MKRSIKISEFLFKEILKIMVAGIIILVGAIFITLILKSLPALKQFGIDFIFNKEWNPVENKFGALPFLYGTLVTSFLALIFSFFFSFSIAILTGEYLKKGFLSNFISRVTELLAAIPSIIYGFWGLFVLVPVIRLIEIKYNLPVYGVGIFTASLILAIMIIPYTTSIAREVISLVPAELKEAAYGLGATRFEVIKFIILPYAKSGIIAGIILSLGRALGETMAVTMVIGNSNFIPKNIFYPGNSMASVIANEFTEATAELHTSSLIEIGLLLFLITTIINLIGKYIVRKSSVEVKI